MAENNRLITGNLVKVNLPSEDRRFKKIVLKIDSKFTQIGDENKIIGLEVQRRQTEAEGAPNIRHLDLNNDSESETSTIFGIQALAVQLNVRGSEQIEIEVKSDEASSLQVGDQCKIYLQDESKAEVNNEVGNASGCRRELFATTRNVMTGAVTRPKHRKRKKPTNKTVSKRQPKKQAKTAPIDSSECLKLCQMFFDKAQRNLHPLRDNGNWSQFDEKWNELLVKYGDDPVWKALLKLEFGVRISYHSKFNSPSYLEQAEKTLREGREIIKRLRDINPSIIQFFEGRYYCYLTSVYRRKKLYGRAQKCIERAEQIFNTTAETSFLYDKATVFYEKGSRYHDFDKLGVDKEAKESLEKCYELCRQIRRDTGCDFIEKGQFALLKKVMVLLGCSTKQGRKRRISDEDREEANKCIDELDKENEQRQSIPISEQLQLLLAKSDNYFRMDDFMNAENMAHQAADLADQHGFDSTPARKRLQDIEVRPDAGEEPRAKQQNNRRGNVETVDHRASCDADGSASASQSTGLSD